MNIKHRIISALMVILIAAGCATSQPNSNASNGSQDIHKIKHIVVIMQENRSFDSYFGTYPGADGIPMKNGVPTVCSPDPKTNQCVKPYHDPSDINTGGGHGVGAYLVDVNGGKLDGFVTAQENAIQNFCSNKQDPNCVQNMSGNQPDVMGYHDRREIPNYWAYADNFVLQDRMFVPNISWSLPSHLFMVSEWSAKMHQPRPDELHQ